MQNLHQLFDRQYIGQIIGAFANFCGLLRTDLYGTERFFNVIIFFAIFSSLTRYQILGGIVYIKPLTNHLFRRCYKLGQAIGVKVTRGKEGECLFCYTTINSKLKYSMSTAVKQDLNFSLKILFSTKEMKKNSIIRISNAVMRVPLPW